MNDGIRVTLLVLAAAIALTGCNRGGGGGGSGKAPHSFKKVGTVTVPPQSYASLAVDDVQTGGGKVNQFIFDSPGLIVIDSITGPDDTIYYVYDIASGGIFWSPWLPFEFWRNYLDLIAGNYTLGALAPITFTEYDYYGDGTYRFMLGNITDTEVEVDVYHAQKTDGDFTSGTVDLNFYVYTAGEPNAIVPNEDEAKNVAVYIEEILSAIGVTVGEVKVEFVDDPAAIDMMDTEANMARFLYSASKATGGRDDAGINCFLMPILPSGILGVDGSVPGPSFVHGTNGSGVLALATNYGLTVEGYTSMEVDQKILAKVLSHEIGHYLGLFHTSERNGAFHDPVGDTPECPEQDDSNGDGIVAATECAGKSGENLMFWSINGVMIRTGQFQVDLSGRQGQIMNTHPSVL